MYAELQVTGTKDDELLQVPTGAPGRRLNVHVCGEACDGVLTDPLLVHGKAVKGPRDARAPDEMARLRELQEKARGEVQRRSW